MAAKSFLDGMDELDVKNPHLVVNDDDRVAKLKEYLLLLNAFYLDLQDQCLDNPCEMKLWSLMRSIRDTGFNVALIVRASNCGESVHETLAGPPESVLQDIKKVCEEARKYYKL